MKQQAELLAQKSLEAALDPDFPAEDVARVFLKFFEGRPFDAQIVWSIAHQASFGRAREIADAAVALESRSVTSLSMAAHVAERAGDAEACAGLWRQAAALSDDSDIRWSFASALLDAGRAAESVPVVQRLVREDPGDFSNLDLQAEMLSQAEEHVEMVGDSEACPCDSGKPFALCCRDREQSALDRFMDRTPFDALRARLVDYCQRPELRRFIWEARKAWFGDEDEVQADEAHQRLFLEWSWREPGLSMPEEQDEEDADYDCVLRRFAADPEVPEDMARLARQWLLDSRWGLWMIYQPQPEPGVWLVDLLSRTRIHAAIPPEQLQGLPRWSVLLGQFGPLDGVWRSGGVFYTLSPSAADRLVPKVWECAEAVARRAIGKHRKKRSELDPYNGFPASAVADSLSPMSDEAARLISGIVAGCLPYLLDLAEQWAHAAPKLRNMDGHDTLLIKAEISVADLDQTWTRLSRHPDFEEAGDHINWLGPEMPPAQAEAARAEMAQWAEQNGVEPPEYDDSPQRWSRGQVTHKGSGLLLDVNSAERLSMFLAILEELGTEPVLLSKTTVDPAQDFAFGRAAASPGPLEAGLSPFHTGRAQEAGPARDATPGHPPEAEFGAAGIEPAPAGAEPAWAATRAWEQAWLEEHVPALDGMTPREAAEDDDGRVLLEALLRDFEYRESGARSSGGFTMSVAALRKELQLE